MIIHSQYKVKYKVTSFFDLYVFFVNSNSNKNIFVCVVDKSRLQVFASWYIIDISHCLHLLLLFLKRIGLRMRPSKILDWCNICISRKKVKKVFPINVLIVKKFFVFKFYRSIQVPIFLNQLAINVYIFVRSILILVLSFINVKIVDWAKFNCNSLELQ